MASACSRNHRQASGVPEIEVAEAVTDSVVLYQTYPGTLNASTVADVVARVNGQILSSHFKSGSHVEKGQTLFTIESSSYADAVEKAESALATALSEYDYYTRQHAAMTKALEADAVSKMEVLQSESNMEQARAAIQSARAALSTARENLGHCTVKAPISGFITSPAFDPGNYVNGEGSAVRLATIYDNSEMTASFSLSDAQYEALIGRHGGINSSSLYRNVPLSFREEMPGKYTVDLYYQAPSVSTTTGTVIIKGKLKNPDPDLKSGMYVTVSLPYGSNPHGVLVKDAAISTDQLGQYLYTVNDSDRVVHTPVETGDLYHDSLRMVTKGIRPGQRYVTKALLTVKPGEKIKPVMTGQSSVSSAQGHQAHKSVSTSKTR